MGECLYCGRYSAYGSTLLTARRQRTVTITWEDTGPHPHNPSRPLHSSRYSVYTAEGARGCGLAMRACTATLHIV
eukprot:5723806-Prymnesium_polylepis.1